MRSIVSSLALWRRKRYLAESHVTYSGEHFHSRELTVLGFLLSLRALLLRDERENPIKRSQTLNLVNTAQEERERERELMPDRLAIWLSQFQINLFTYLFCLCKTNHFIHSSASILMRFGLKCAKIYSRNMKPLVCCFVV